MDNKYDFEILFKKLKETIEEEAETLGIDIEQNKEICEEINYLKEIYDNTIQEEPEVLTRS